MSRNYMSQNDELRRGAYLLSNNGQWKTVFRDDGNFVVYGWKPVWASNTDGSEANRLCMQADCNLVLYDKRDKPKWASNTYTPGSHLCRLHLTDDGKLVVSREAQHLWSS